MKYLILSVIFCIFLLGCSIVEVKQSHYKREIPDIPTKELPSVEDIGAVAVGATEINKGLQEIYQLSKLSDVIPSEDFIKKMKELLPRLKVLVDFSYTVMGWIGVAWESIDWENPDKWIEQVKQKQQAMETALKNEQDAKLKLEKDLQKFKDTLAKTEKAVKDKETELAENDGKWSVKFSWWVGLLKWIIIIILILGCGWYLWGAVQRWGLGLPFKAVLFGAKTGHKIIKQTIGGIQVVREKLKEKAKSDLHAKQLLAEIDETLHKVHDEDVFQAIKQIKEKNGFTKRGEE